MDSIQNSSGKPNRQAKGNWDRQTALAKINLKKAEQC